MSDLGTYRKEIDEIDEQILHLLAKRQAQVIKIAHLKVAEGLKPYQPVRHETVIEYRQGKAAEHGLNPAMVGLIWQAIMAEAIRIQGEIINDKTG